MLKKGISYPSKGKGRQHGSLGPSWEGRRPNGTMGPPYLAWNGLIFKGCVLFCFVLFVRPGPLRGLKGRV